MKSSLLALAASLACVAPAHALCIYDGELYAKTTLSQEFRDSAIVVRGKVVSSKDMWPWGEDEEWGTVYKIEVEQTYKGAPPPVLTFLTERNSGGFYLDDGVEYLLFLTPWDRTDRWMKVAPGAYGVNYNCGQSRPWAEVPTAERTRLGRF